LLILDEPTSGLDVLARDELMDMLHDYIEDGEHSVLFSTHITVLDELMDMLHDYIEDGEHSVLFSTHITVDLERAADFITYITGGR
ncbi:hypothetical protein B5U84_09930, partial [Bifidobacterium bifidum]